MSQTNIQQSVEDAQWEAEYGEERERLLAEELAAAKADGGERDHDACFPKSQVWTIWIHRLDQYGLLVRFTDRDEAMNYGRHFLSGHSTEHYLAPPTGYEEMKPIGQSKDLQVFMFKGVQHAKLAEAEGLYIVDKQTANKYGVSGTPAVVKSTDKPNMFKVIS